MVRALALASFSVLLAAPALAAQEKPAFIPKQEVLADFAACVFKANPERTRALLATEIDSSDERSLATSLMVSQTQCTGGRAFVSMNTGEARGALAEAVLKSDASLVQSVQLLEPEAITRPTETVGRKFVMAYSRCLVSAAPDKARGLIITDHGSGEENSAMMAFGEALKDCMPLGFAYNINIRDVRNHVAAALYDRAMASPVGGDLNA
ncbi:hypothetical protein [Blastomonas sp.]|uniref:hypothetical protein n=1 Tax=Blastomonas sp. TaxID=1909299 RepID=UPI00391C720F